MGANDTVFVLFLSRFGLTHLAPGYGFLTIS